MTPRVVFSVSVGSEVFQRELKGQKVDLIFAIKVEVNLKVRSKQNF